MKRGREVVITAAKWPNRGDEKFSSVAYQLSWRRRPPPHTGESDKGGKGSCHLMRPSGQTGGSDNSGLVMAP